MLRLTALALAVAALIGAAPAKRPAYSFKRIATGFASPTYVTSAPDDASRVA